MEEVIAEDVVFSTRKTYEYGNYHTVSNADTYTRWNDQESYFRLEINTRTYTQIKTYSRHYNRSLLYLRGTLNQ